MTTSELARPVKPACVNLPTRIFFPIGGDSIEPAMHICSQCPDDAKQACEIAGIGQKFGIWAGELRRTRKTTVVECFSCQGRMLRRGGHYKEEICHVCRGGFSEESFEEEEPQPVPVAVPVPGVCFHCGADFEPIPRKKFCSKRCQRRSSEQPLPKLTVACIECGVKFEASRSNHICCSRACQEHRKERLR